MYNIVDMTKFIEVVNGCFCFIANFFAQVLFKKWEEYSRHVTNTCTWNNTEKLQCTGIDWCNTIANNGTLTT